MDRASLIKNMFSSTKAKKAIGIYLLLTVMIWAVVIIPLMQDREDIILGADDVTVHWDERSYYYFLDITLDKGVYLVTVNYEAVHDLQASIYMDHSTDGILKSTPITLLASNEVSQFRVMAGMNNTRCRLDIQEIDETESFYAVELHATISYKPKLTIGYYSIKVFITLLGILSVILLLVWIRNCPDTDKQVAAYGLMVMVFVFLFALALDAASVTKGGDQEFHMMRIANLAEAFRHNILQFRMQPGWHNGYGYPVAYFYGELLFVPSALLYLAGLPLYQSYHVMHFLTAALLILCSYFSFKKISKDRILALAGSVIYIAVSKFAWRMLIGSIGNVQALAFLPLVVAGFYAACTDDDEDSVLYLVLGFTGLIHTHLLTTTRAFLFAVFFFLLERRILFKTRKILSFVKAAVITLIINIWFMIPILDYYFRYDLACEISHLIDGEAPSKVFLDMTAVEYLWIMMALFCLLCVKQDKEERRHGSILFGLYSFAVFLQTNLMPYKWLYFHIPLLYHIFAGGIQFVRRYATISALFGAVFGLYEMGILIKREAYKKFAMVITIFISMTALISIFSSLKTGTQELPVWSEGYLDVTSVDPANRGDNLYLFDDIDFDPWVEEKVLDTHVYAEGVAIESMNRDYAKWEFTVANEGNSAGYVELPVLNYYGYYAEGDGGVRFALSDGEDHRIRVEIPSEYAGQLVVNFAEPWYWRLTEVISATGIVIFAVYEYRRKKREVIVA